MSVSAVATLDIQNPLYCSLYSNLISLLLCHTIRSEVEVTLALYLVHKTEECPVHTVCTCAYLRIPPKL